MKMERPKKLEEVVKMKEPKYEETVKTKEPKHEEALKMGNPKKLPPMQPLDTLVLPLEDVFIGAGPVLDNKKNDNIMLSIFTTLLL